MGVEVILVAPVATKLQKGIEAVSQVVFVRSGAFLQGLCAIAEEASAIRQVLAACSKRAPGRQLVLRVAGAARDVGGR